MKKFYLLFVGFILSLTVFSQADSCHLRISLLTCGPGNDLYSIFGHTGIRVTDSLQKRDMVFNYGTFDDSDPYFYVKFTRGIMIYSLSVDAFPEFMEEYQQDHRSVTEQVLQLTCEEKNKLLTALINNAKESNRYYEYRFHTDNCTTRARDMMERNSSKPMDFKEILSQPPPSFRQLINNCLDQGQQYWSKLGINMFLGSHLDEKVSTRQSMFLPDYLMKGVDSCTVAGKPLVAFKQNLLTAENRKRAIYEWISPSVIFSLLLIINVALSFSSRKKNQVIVRVFDSVLFFITGLFGVLMVALWAGRVDTVCRNNFNLIWAIPTHTFIAFLRSGKANWVSVYWKITSALLLFLLVAWIWLPQELNNALFPLIALLLWRSMVKAGWLKTAAD